MPPFRIETGRLQLRWLDLDDAPFILELVNDPDWLSYIGDKGVNDLDAARRYIETGPVAMYRRYGFGLNRVALKHDDTPIGICGLLKRDKLPDIELGFALLATYRGQGYAQECARAVLENALAGGARRVAAIVHPQNRDSHRLLRKLGFDYRRRQQIRNQGGDLDLYVIES